MARPLSAEVRALAATDPAMAALIERVGPRSIADRRSYEDPFEALARIVTGQQVSTSAARTIWERVCEQFGGRAPTAVEAASSQERLRSCGLSGRKASYVAGIGVAIASGRLDTEALQAAEDAEVIEALTELRGVGRWTAEMFLMFHLARTDVFSGGDLGLRNGIRLVHELSHVPSPEEATAIAERWRPHRTLASIYLWEALGAGPPG